MKFMILTLCLILCVPVLSRAEDTLNDAFDLIGRIIESDVANGFPSAQLAVIKDGELLYSSSWGSAPDTLYDLASNTKMYSVAYAMQYLESRGLVSCDDRICDILGDEFVDETVSIAYAGYDSVPPETQKEWKRSLTIKDVMCHRAGFPPDPGYYLEYYDFASQAASDTVQNLLYAGKGADGETRNATYRALCATPPMCPPRTMVLYSDVDYMLMGFVIEKVTGQRLDEFLAATFFEPLGLDHITYLPPENGFSPEDCAPTELRGNTRDGVRWFDGIRDYTLRGEVHDEKAWYCMAGVSGHAGLFASAQDLARLAYLMVEPQGYFTDDVVERYTSAADTDIDNWGIGWYRQGDLKRVKYFSDRCPENTVGHQGWTGTLTLIDRENRLVIVLLTNKIASPVTDPAKNPNMFDGNHYLTATLGFASQLIYDAMLGIPFDNDLNAMEQKLIAQAEDDPCEASERALKAFRLCRGK